MADKKSMEKHMLPGDVTIYGVAALRSQFSAWLDKLPKGRRAAALKNTALAVDASAVSEVDAAGVQMLVALSKSLAARGRPLRLVNPSDLMTGALETLGVTALLMANDSSGAAA